MKSAVVAHLPSGSFMANSAWLVCAVVALNLNLNLNLSRRHLASRRLSHATTGTIRRVLIAVPARVASSARRLTLHLPQNRP